jgi:hypothetical protein
MLSKISPNFVAVLIVIALFGAVILALAGALS